MLSYTIQNVTTFQSYALMKKNVRLHSVKSNSSIKPYTGLVHFEALIKLHILDYTKLK